MKNTFKSSTDGGSIKSKKGFTLRKGLMWLATIVMIVIFALGQPFNTNDAGYRQVVQTWAGDLSVRFEPGFYYAGLFNTTTVYPDVATIVYATPKNQELLTEEVSYLSEPIEIRFSDVAKAKAESTTKFRLPNNEEQMILIHKDNRSIQKFVISVLEPYNNECLNFAAQIMESETHYSGGKSKMAEDFQSQLEEGQYVIDVKTEYVIDSTNNNKNKITKSYIRSDANGMPIRKKNNLKQFGVTIATATIKSVDYDPIIDEKLKAKIESSTRESISKQEAITAEQEALTAKIKGEKLIAETKAREYSAKLEAVIRAEKVAAVAEQNLKTAKLNAAAELALKKAQAEGDKLKVIAGLSPLEKATIQKETAIGIAEALAKRPVPSIVMAGGSNGGKQSNLSSGYAMEEMLLVMDKLAKGNK